MSLLRIALALTLTLVGCSAEEAVDTSDDAVIDATETFEHPEIGMLHNGNSYCTATLIRPNVVLSSAHCVTNSPKDEAVTGYSWDLKASATETHHYTIARAYAVPSAPDFDGTQTWRAKDIALLELTESVPAELAKPMVAATTRPANGAAVALYGYGCIDRTPDANGHRPGGGVKRTASWTWSAETATRHTCPGDSGGPWIDVAAGAIFGTTSGYVNQDDVPSDVAANVAIVNEIADRWAHAVTAP